MDNYSNNSDKVRPLLVGLTIALTLVGYQSVATAGDALGIPSTPLSIAVRTTILASSTILIATNLRRKSITLSASSYCLLVFTALYTARLVFDVTFQQHSIGNSPEYYLTWWFGTSLVPAAAIFSTRIDRRSILLSYKLTYALSSASCSYLLVTLLITRAGLETSRFGLEALNPISVGYAGLTLIILSSTKIRTGPIKAIKVATALIGLLLVAASGSKGPIVTLFILFSIYIIGGSTSQRLKIAFVTVPILGISLIAFGDFFANSLSVVDTRFAATQSGEDMSTLIRIQLYSNSWRQFLESPFLGSLIEERESKFYPHNILLESLISTGIFGTGLLAYVLFYCTRSSIKNLNHKEATIWIKMICLQQIVASQFSGSLITSSSLWITMAYISSKSRKCNELH